MNVSEIMDENLLERKYNTKLSNNFFQKNNDKSYNIEFNENLNKNYLIYDYSKQNNNINNNSNFDLHHKSNEFISDYYKNELTQSDKMLLEKYINKNYINEYNSFNNNDISFNKIRNNFKNEYDSFDYNNSDISALPKNKINLKFSYKNDSLSQNIINEYNLLNNNYYVNNHHLLKNKSEILEPKNGINNIWTNKIYHYYYSMNKPILKEDINNNNEINAVYYNNKCRKEQYSINNINNPHQINTYLVTPSAKFSFNDDLKFDNNIKSNINYNNHNYSVNSNNNNTYNIKYSSNYNSNNNANYFVMQRNDHLVKTQNIFNYSNMIKDYYPEKSEFMKKIHSSNNMINNKNYNYFNNDVNINNIQLMKNNYKMSENFYLSNKNKKYDKITSGIGQNKINNKYYNKYTPEIKRKSNQFIKKNFLEYSQDLNKSNKKVKNYHTDKNKKNKKKIKIEKILKPYKYVLSKNIFQITNKEPKEKHKDELSSKNQDINIKKENKKNIIKNNSFYQGIKNHFTPKIESKPKTRNPYLNRTYQINSKKENNKNLFKYSTIISDLLNKNSKAIL